MNKKQTQPLLNRITLLQTRFIRFRDAPYYLGMDRDLFNDEVRPYLVQIPIKFGRS